MSPTLQQPPATDQVVDIADQVHRIAVEDPERIALVHATRRFDGRIHYRRHTYRELDERVQRLAAGLADFGIGRGTLCSFMVPPGLDAMVLGVALWKLGAVVVGIEPHSHGLRTVARCLAKVGPEVFIGTPPAHAARLAFGWGRSTVHKQVIVGPVGLPGAPTLGSLERRGASKLRAGTAPTPEPPLPADIAVVAFTTGSTGAPKPTVLRQRNLAAMMQMVLGHWGYAGRSDVVDMVTFPMFWIIGLAAGGTVVVPPMDFTLKGPGDADPALLIRTIHECGVTSMFASPALLTNLATYARDHAVPLGLRRIVAGGAEVPGPLFAAARILLAPDGEMYSDYGATEAVPVAEIAGQEVLTETWADTEAGAGVCVGRPLPGVEVRIVAIHDGPIMSFADATLLPPGEIGEVIARSPHISEEYYRQPEADRDNKIPDGNGGSWHRLGDTGYLDERGRLWVCGRRSHRVVTDRGVVFPLQCEPVFNAHPRVARTALVGVSTAQGTHAVLCVELADPSADREAVAAELRALADRFDSTRLIDDIQFLDRLPVDRRHNAKIDRPGIGRRLSTERRGADGAGADR